MDFLRFFANGGECKTSGDERMQTVAMLTEDRVRELEGHVAVTLVSGQTSSGSGGVEVTELAKVTYTRSPIWCLQQSVKP